jgi:hypothetical protein
MGRRGIFSSYPFLHVGAFAPFIAGRVPQGVEPKRGVSASPDGMGRCDATNAAIMAIVGVEASVRLPLSLPIIGVLGPSAITAPLRLPVLLISLLLKPKPFPFYAPALARAPDPLCRPKMASWYRSEVGQAPL